MATVVSRLVFVAFMVLAVSVKGGAAEPSRTLTVRFQNGDFVPGNLAEIAGPPAGVSASSDSLGLLKWRSSAFLEPLSVPWELVQTIHAPAIVDPPQVPAAPFGFELVSGETIYGDLKSLSLDEIEIASRVLGPLRVPRGVVRQFFANNNSPSVFAGPQGLRGWYSARPKEPHFGMNPWAQNPDLQIEWVRSPFRLKHWGDSEAPATSVLGAQIRSEFELPAKARIELDLSWARKAGFAIAVGGGIDGNRDRFAFRLEVWDQELVLVREDDTSADIQPLLTIPAGNGGLRLQMLYDRAAERLVVFSGGGRALADMTFKPQARTNSPSQARPVPRAQRPANPMAEMLIDNPDQPGTKESVSPIPARKEPTELVITNVDGDLRIDGFRVSTWNGVVPGTVDIGKPRLLRADGRQEIADVIAYEAAKGELRLKEAAGERVEPLAGFAQVIVSDQRLAPTGNGLHLHLHTGDRLFGLPLASPSGQLRLQHASLGRVLEISIADLQSVSVQIDKETTARVVASMRSPSAVADAATKVAEPPGAGDSQLQWNGGLLKGRLVDGSRSIGSTALVWKAAVADSPTSLRGDFSGKIVANKKLEPTGGSAPKDVATQDGEQPVGMVARLMQRTLRAAFGAANAPADAAPSAVADSSTIAASNALDAANTPPASHKLAVNRIHLRTGEVIPCNRLAVDEQGVRIESPVAASKRLAHSQVKAIELLPNAKPPQPAKVKRDRLLMVPRVNRDHPPTHVVRSRDADYLRGRLIELNEKELTIEVRMETKRLPRALVSHVIWISPDELAGPVSPAGPAGPSGPTSPAVPAGSPGAADGDAAASPAAPPIPRADSGLMVLALRKDGVRLAFEPTECRDGIIAGTNRNLGDVRVDVRNVDEFLIGGAIAEARAAMPYARWRWTAATLPKVASAQGKDADGARLPGIDSPLVGKPAPDFKLPMLSGKEDFELSKQRGRIVVLDFWATWCGPCLKTIPVLDKVVGELPPEAKVDLVAVNLEETPKQIASLLERQKWKMAVALDQDGAVAAKYAAAAIPQTVIVDRDGKVARLFVGGGPQFEADLRAALTELLRRQ